VHRTRSDLGPGWREAKPRGGESRPGI